MMVAGKVKVSRQQKRPAEPSWAEYSLRSRTGQTSTRAYFGVLGAAHFPVSASSPEATAGRWLGLEDNLSEGG